MAYLVGSREGWPSVSNIIVHDDGEWLVMIHLDMARCTGAIEDSVSVFRRVSDDTVFATYGEDDVSEAVPLDSGHEPDWEGLDAATQAYWVANTLIPDDIATVFETVAADDGTSVLVTGMSPDCEVVTWSPTDDEPDRWLLAWPLIARSVTTWTEVITELRALSTRLTAAIDADTDTAWCTALILPRDVYDDGFRIHSISTLAMAIALTSTSVSVATWARGRPVIITGPAGTFSTVACATTADALLAATIELRARGAAWFEGD